MIIEIEGLKLWPAYFCFQDGGDGGDGGDGNGDAGVGDAGVGDGEGDGVGDEGGPGPGPGPGPAGAESEGSYGPSPGDLGVDSLSEAFGMPSYESEPLYESEPSYEAPPSYDINEAFSFAEIGPEAEPVSQPFGEPSPFKAQPAFDLGPVVQDAIKIIDNYAPIALPILALVYPPAAIPVAIAMIAAKGLQATTGQKPAASIFGALGLAESKGPAPAPAPTPSPVPSVAPQGYSLKGAPISIGPYQGESPGGGISSIPVTFQAAMPSPRPYPSLSTSLFGPQKESSGGLMIFPTSTRGVEPEGSSLLKKQDVSGAGPFRRQEPLVDTTSLLFLLGMGAVGMVLRKGARV